MNASCAPESAPETPDDEQEILLRLSDILPKVPPHLLKPGPHDTMAQIRFTIDELAEKISRGRVSVPLQRLSSVCPEVFRDSGAFPGDQEVPLPLQKLLEQIGLVVPKPAGSNGTPGDQFAQARAHATKILQAGSANTPAPAVPPVPAAPPPTPPPAISPAIAKAISTARQLLGLFGRQNISAPPPATAREPANEVPPAQPPPTPSTESAETPAPVQTAPPMQSTPEPAPQPASADCISLRVLPIFRLLSSPVLKPGMLPAESARMTLPLSSVESQLADGHVEIPIEAFHKSLSEDLRQLISPIPGAKVWIPLDEIFQSLPPDHLFYMPPFDPAAESLGNIEPEPLPESAPCSHEPATRAEPLPPVQPEPPKAEAPMPVTEEASPEPPPAPSQPASEAAPAPQPETATPEPTLSAEATLIESPQPAPVSRAPWMRGFQIPPPRLFATAATPAEPSPQPAPAEPPPAAPAATPEAKRTADFLASQPGIFAAAAFVEGAVFASNDFPRKPDLDALRDFMGHFIDFAQDSGRRLGWNRVLNIPCEQFHLTAVVRDTHFIVALHHDRILDPLTYDSLIAAAEELGKSASES